MILRKLDVTNSIKISIKKSYQWIYLSRRCFRSTTGEVLAEAGTNVDMKLADKIQNTAVASVMIQTEEGATKYFPTWK